ncbi:CatB-related O-acetyltransferase [Geothrix sp. 21YS21S-4]|uniref:CatB-related O-acetyltransferase n=1 Tax=Geothrix sp. 21YS21S-4 TaxID=3068889 RepID=UPI0027BAAE7E|nr:CatB-related O-acetyltransferase [Geothrix sp. 21YS21S-4]
MLGVLKKLVKWGKFSLLARRRGIRIGKHCHIGFHSELEGGNTILDGTTFDGRLGYGSYLGERCRISGSIGRYCSISAEVATILGRHPTAAFVSTHPAFYSLQKQAGFTYTPTQLFDEYAFADPEDRYCVVIGNDVLISHGVKLLEGVTVGDGAILAAGSLVRSDVEPYAIYAGVPARKIGQRFDDATIEHLLKLRWWDRDEDWLRIHAPLFQDIERFLASCREDLEPHLTRVPE